MTHEVWMGSIVLGNAMVCTMVCCIVKPSYSIDMVQLLNTCNGSLLNPVNDTMISTCHEPMIYAMIYSCNVSML